MNNISYADDMVLLCPSVKSLRKLIGICERFAGAHDIIYNTKKTECMMFTSSSIKINVNPSVTLSGDKLRFVERFKYLGHFLSCTLSDDLDIGRQYRGLCARANMLRRNFFYCSNDVKTLLFKTYCTCLYTVHLWITYSVQVMSKFIVCYNNAFRWLMGYAKFCSASSMFVENRVPSFGELRRRLVFKFMQRLAQSSNDLVTHLLRCDTQWCSPFWRKWYSLLTI